MKTKLFILLFVLSLFSKLPSVAQDTSEILNYVKFPEMEAQLTLTFSASDFVLDEKPQIKTLKEIDVLKKKIKGDAQDAEIYDQMNSIYSNFNRNEEAMQAYKKSKELFMQQLSAAPEDTAIIMKMGDLFYSNQQMNMALLYYNEIFKIDTTNTNLMDKIALANFFTGKADKAYQVINKAIALQPDDIGLYCSLTLMNLMERIRELSTMPDEEFEKVGFKDFFDYDYLIEGAKANPDDERFELFLNSLKLTAIMYKSIFDIAGQLEKGSPKVVFNPDDNVKAELKKIKKTLLRFTDVENPIFAYKNLMIAEFLMGNLEPAITYFEKIKAINPYYSEAFNNMMAMYLMQEDYDNSIKVIKEIAQVKPSVNYYLLLSRLYYEKENYESAMEWALKAKELNQSVPDIFLGISAIFFKQHQFDEACGLTYDLVKYLPNEPMVIYHLGVCELLQGNKSKAHEYFNQLIEAEIFVEDCKALIEI